MCGWYEIVFLFGYKQTFLINFYMVHCLLTKSIPDCYVYDLFITSDYKKEKYC